MRGTRRVGIAAATIGLCAAAWPAAGAAQSQCRPAPSPADETVLTALINAERRAGGVRVMVTKAELKRAGRAKSLAMARGARFGHSGAPVAGPGYAQNIAMAPSVVHAFQAMLASPPHRKNLMARHFRLGGVGAARDCAGMIFFTINLMTPPPR